MAAFKPGIEDWNRLDCQILSRSSVSLYFRREVLAEDVDWLRQHGYRVYSFDCANWTTTNHLHGALSTVLSFPSWYGRNLDALNDVLRDVLVPDDGGLALQFVHFDLFMQALPREAQVALEIIERTSRHHLLFGRRFIALVQTDDPTVQSYSLGQSFSSWNHREWLYKDRGVLQDPESKNLVAAPTSLAISKEQSAMPNTPRATFGLIISANYPATTDLSARLADHRQQIQLAREAGFTSVVTNQHFLSHPTTAFSTIPYLTSVIDISGDMKLVIGVALMPLQNPVYLAEDVATLDWLSGGRAILGLAMGYRPEEFASMGVSLRERRGRFEEGIEVMKRIWDAEESWSFEGRYYNYENLPGGLKPKQKPHPPMWFAADVDVAVERAGRLGAAWYSNPRAGLTSLKRQAEIYRASLAEHGNQVPEIFPLRRELFIAPTDAEARRVAVPHIIHQLELYQSWGQFEAMPKDDQPPMTFDEDNIPDAFLVGSPESLADQINRYVDALGVNHFVCKLQWAGMEHKDVMRSIDLIGNQLSAKL